MVVFNHYQRASIMVLLAFIVFAVGLVAGTPEPDFKVVSAGYFKQLDHVTPYETTAKLIYKVNLPTVSFAHASVCNSLDTSCRFKQMASSIYFDNSRIIQSLVGHHEREKRQAMALVVGAVGGYFLHSALAKFSTGVSGTESQASREIHRIKVAMTHNNKENLLFEKSIQHFAMEVNDEFIKTRLRERKDVLLAFRMAEFSSQLRGIFSRVEIGLQSCLSGLKPFTILTSDLLRKSLEDISADAKSHGLMLSIPTSDFDKYYKVRICDCFLTNSTMYIMVNVPLSRVPWKIMELLPIPFAYENHVCSIDVSHRSLIAIGQDIVLLDSYAMHHCDIRRDHLCLIPSLSRPAEKMSTCIESMYRKSSVETFKHACKLNYYPGKEIVVYEVNPSLLVLANAPSLSVNCPAWNQQYALESTGAVEIHMRCNCTYTMDNRKYYSYDSCLPGEHVFGDVVTILPDLWVKTDKYVQDGLLKSHAKEDILDRNWTLKIPVSNYTMLNPDEISTFELDYQGIVIIVVSCLVAVLLLVLGGMLFHYCKFYSSI